MRPRQPVREKSRRTREHILFAAERLFAERGFSSSSMRDITAAAGVNLSVVYYYFKDKEALLFSVIESFVLPIMERERELLRAARGEAGADEPIPPRRLVESMILPRAECGSESARRLMMRLFSRSGPFEKKVFARLSELTKDVRDESAKEFCRTFSHLSEEEVRFRIANFVAMLNGWGAVAPFLKDAGMLRKEFPRDRRTYYEMLIALVLRLFDAPAMLPVPAEAERI